MRRVGGGLFSGVAVLVYSTGRDDGPSIYGQSDTLTLLSCSVISCNLTLEGGLNLPELSPVSSGVSGSVAGCVSSLVGSGVVMEVGCSLATTAALALDGCDVSLDGCDVSLDGCALPLVGCDVRVDGAADGDGVS